MSMEGTPPELHREARRERAAKNTDGPARSYCVQCKRWYFRHPEFPIQARCMGCGYPPTVIQP